MVWCRHAWWLTGVDFLTSVPSSSLPPCAADDYMTWFEIDLPRDSLLCSSPLLHASVWAAVMTRWHAVSAQAEPPDRFGWSRALGSKERVGWWCVVVTSQRVHYKSPASHTTWGRASVAPFWDRPEMPFVVQNSLQVRQCIVSSRSAIHSH